MVTKKSEAAAEMDIVKVVRGSLSVKILGVTPLVCNRMSEKAARELLQPGGRKSAAQKMSSLKHDPIAEFRASPYTDKDPNSPTLIVLPAVMFKAAMGVAALDIPGATKSRIGRLTYVDGSYVPVWGDVQLMMSIVRDASINKTPDVRTRAVLVRWATELTVTFVKPIINETSVFNLIVASGMTAGVGDWRIEKGHGNFGSFEVVNGDDPRWLELQAYGRNVQSIAMANPEAFDTETEALLSWYQETAKAKGFEPTQAGDEDDEDEDDEARAEQARDVSPNGRYAGVLA